MFNNNLTKQLNDLELFELFFQSPRLRLKTKGLIGQFSKMDVSKFQGLMKVKLNIHSDWNRWSPKLLALILPLWIFSYERLFSDHTIRPPSWVKAWLETKMTMDSMTERNADRA